VKDIQESIAVLNSTVSLIFKAKEKLNYELQKIVALQSNDYDSKCVDNALDIELDIFHNNLDLDALRKVMLKGDVGLYRLVEVSSVKFSCFHIFMILNIAQNFLQTYNMWYR